MRFYTCNVFYKGEVHALGPQLWPLFYLKHTNVYHGVRKRSDCTLLSVYTHFSNIYTLHVHLFLLAGSWGVESTQATFITDWAALPFSGDGPWQPPPATHTPSSAIYLYWTLVGQSIHGNAVVTMVTVVVRAFVFWCMVPTGVCLLQVTLPAECSPGPANSSKVEATCNIHDTFR